jgi:iron complex transport system ATP-binding protein
MNATAPRLEARSVHYAIHGRVILRDVTLSIAPGELAALVGPNGSGKTSLLRLLTHSRKPTSGSVVLDGVPIQQWSRAELACRMAYMPQNTFTDFDIRVEDAVAMGRFPHLGAFRPMSPADVSAVREAMRQTGLESLAKRALPTLSAGERQRVFLARALAQGSPVFILDEPTSALDVGHQLELIELLLQLHAGGRTIIAALHDLRLAHAYFPRTLLLDSGSLKADGPTSGVLASPAARDAFHVRIETRGDLIFTKL